MQHPVKIGICGLGTVGGGTFHLLRTQGEQLSRRLGKSLLITHIASRRHNPAYDAQGIQFSDDIFNVVNDPEVDIVVEVLGGFDPALKLVMTAIDKGKHVVTANKALIAVHGNEIFAAAEKKGVIVAFESAVAGGIPIVKALREGLAANSISWLAGIINGTGNFILSEMGHKHRSFEDVLEEAQQRGYAEADPSFDVEGIDAAHKLTILASIAFGIPLQFDKVYTEGISKITIEDIKYADELGYTIKHLGIARLTEKGIELRVHPTLISKHCLIANVHGVMNAVVVNGNSVGSTLYYGAGAGAEVTASAVVADIMDIARALNSAGASPAITMPCLGFSELNSDLPVLDIENIEAEYYLRISAQDRVGVMAKISEILRDHGVSIEAVIQKEPGRSATIVSVSIVLLTHKVLERKINEVIAQLQSLDEIVENITRIRLDELDGDVDW